MVSLKLGYSLDPRQAEVDEQKTTREIFREKGIPLGTNTQVSHNGRTVTPDQYDKSLASLNITANDFLTVTIKMDSNRD